MTRTIEQIDQAIDGVRRALMCRLHFDPGFSAHQWQAAWDSCPDLHLRETALFRERGLAQQERDQRAEREYRSQQRRARAAARKSEYQRCPTCGFHTLAV